MRKCNMCKAQKDESEFQITRKPYRSSYCNDCKKERDRKRCSTDEYKEKRKEKDKKYYTENKKRIFEKQRENRLKLRTQTIEAYGGRCACCGENNVEFLCVDHVNGGGNKERKETGRRGNMLHIYLKRNGYPSTYRILCHNCNMSLGIYGYCPHKTTPHPSL